MFYLLLTPNHVHAHLSSLTNIAGIHCILTYTQTKTHNLYVPNKINLAELDTCKYNIRLLIINKPILSDDMHSNTTHTNICLPGFYRTRLAY